MTQANLQADFISKMNEIYSKCVGHETYGDTTEFYDEDGVVMMTATEQNDNKILFRFGGEEESYEYDEVDRD